jgi:hypothetical protein
VNLGTMRTELKARGFDHLTDARLNQFLADACSELDDLELWPYRLTTATGSAPLTIADLGVIEEVVNTTNASQPLSRADRRSLVDWYGDVTTTGTPSWFYFDNGVVRTFPVGGTLSVRYYKAPAQLSSDSDTPSSPARFHMLVVSMAEKQAMLLDESDDAEVAFLQQEIASKQDQMRSALLTPQVVGVEMLMDYGASTDW